MFRNLIKYYLFTHIVSAQLVVILPNGKVALVDFNQIKSKLSQAGKNIYFTTTQESLEAYLSRLSS